MNRFLTRSVACAALLLTVTTIGYAQTGPTGSVLGNNNPPINAPASNQMTPQNALEILQRLGHRANLVKHNNGAYSVAVTINAKDGWRFVVELCFSANGKNLDFIMPLGNSTSQFSSAQLVELFKKSFDIGPVVHFSIRSQDMRLCLEDPLYNTVGMNEQGLVTTLDRLIKLVRDTHPLWDTARWPVAGTAQAAPSTSTLGGTPPAQAVAPGMPVANTVFKK